MHNAECTSKMNRASFEERAARGTEQASSDFEQYIVNVRKQLLALDFVAYAIFVVTVSLATSLVFLIVKFPRASLAWILVFLGLSIFSWTRCMIARQSAPQGYVVSRNDAHALFAFLDTIQTSLRAPKVHSVVIVPYFAVFASESTRFGPFGKRFHVVLGLSSLSMLPENQLRSMMAKAIALYGKDVSDSISLDRRARLWLQRLRLFESSSRFFVAGLNFALIKSKLYAFLAFSLPAQRQSELDTDLLAAQETDTDGIAGAIVRAAIDNRTRNKWLDEAITVGYFSPDGTRTDFFEEVDGVAQKALDFEAAGELIAELNLRTQETHDMPSLVERLRALDVPVQFDSPNHAQELLDRYAFAVHASAGRVYLGDAFNVIRNSFTDHYAQQLEEERQDRNSLIAVGTMALRHPNAPLLAKAIASWHLESAKTALPKFREALGEQPDYAVAKLWFGQCLASVPDEECIALLESCLEFRQTKLGALEGLVKYYASVGNNDALEAITSELNKERDERVAYDELLGKLSSKDALTPYSYLNYLGEELRGIEDACKSLQSIYVFDRVPNFDPTCRQTCAVFLYKMPSLAFDKAHYQSKAESVLLERPSLVYDQVWVIPTRDIDYKWIQSRPDLCMYVRGSGWRPLESRAD